MSQHMTQQSFAEFLGVSPAALSSLFSGRSNPTLTYVDAIKKKLPTINLAWLMFGEGEMFNDVDPGSVDLSVQPEQKNQNVQPDIFGDVAGTSTHSGGLYQYRQDGRFSTPNNEQILVKNFNKPIRQITEIRIFFDDQTFESFVAKK